MANATDDQQDDIKPEPPRRMSLIARQAEKIAPAPRRSMGGGGGAGNAISLLVRVRKAAKAMERRTRVRKSALEKTNPEMMDEAEPSFTNDDYVYVDLSGITSAALVADKEPELITLDDLITKCLNIEKKTDATANEETISVFVNTYRMFTSAENLVKTLFTQYISAMNKSMKMQITKALVQFLLKVLPDLTEQELSQCSTALSTWEGRVKQDNENWYQQVRKAVQKVTDRRQGNLPVNHDSLIESYADELPPICDVKGRELAEQLTLVDSWYYERVEPVDLIIAVTSGSLTTKKTEAMQLYWQHMMRTQDWFSELIDTICNQNNKTIELYLDRLLTIIKTLRKLNNFGTFFALLSTLENAPLRGDGKSTERQKAVDRFWFLMSEYKDLMLGTNEPGSAYKRLLDKYKATSHVQKISIIPDMNLMFVTMRRFITFDGMLFYNSGINFQKNINVYKELREFIEFKSMYQSYKIEPKKPILKLLCSPPPKSGYIIDYRGGGGRKTSAAEQDTDD